MWIKDFDRGWALAYYLGERELHQDDVEAEAGRH